MSSLSAGEVLRQIPPLQANERRTKVRTGHVLPKVFCEPGHVDPHIEFRRLLQSNDAAGYQILRRSVVAGEEFQIRRGELDEGLEEVSCSVLCPTVCQSPSKISWHSHQ